MFHLHILKNVITFKKLRSFDFLSSQNTWVCEMIAKKLEPIKN